MIPRAVLDRVLEVFPEIDPARVPRRSSKEGIVHRVIPWDDVVLDDGTGIVHIAPGAGAEDFELSRVHDLPVLMPIDESGRMLPGYADLEGRTTDAVEEPVIESLHEGELRTRVAGYVATVDESIRAIREAIYRMTED